MAPALPIMPIPSAPSPNTRRLKILIADDGRNAADVMGLFFELEGHEPMVVYDGGAAVEAVKDFGPDVIVMDLTMPGIDGLEAARAIRRLDPGKRLRMYACSGGPPEEDARRAREAGFDGHLPKSVTPDMLREFLAAQAAG